MAEDVSPAKLAKILPNTYSFLQKNFSDGSVKHDAAIRGIVSHLRSVHPKHNVVVCHPQQLSDLNNSTSIHMELKPGWWGTIGVDIYILTHGTFTLVGDGGFINWDNYGNYAEDPDNPKTVTFPHRQKKVLGIDFYRSLH